MTEEPQRAAVHPTSRHGGEIERERDAGCEWLQERWEEGNRRGKKGGGGSEMGKVGGREGDCNTQAAGSAAGQ